MLRVLLYVHKMDEKQFIKIIFPQKSLSKQTRHRNQNANRLKNTDFTPIQHVINGDKYSFGKVRFPSIFSTSKHSAMDCVPFLHRFHFICNLHRIKRSSTGCAICLVMCAL